MKAKKETKVEKGAKAWYVVLLEILVSCFVFVGVLICVPWILHVVLFLPAPFGLYVSISVAAVIAFFFHQKVFLGKKISKNFSKATLWAFFIIAMLPQFVLLCMYIWVRYLK